MKNITTYLFCAGIWLNADAQKQDSVAQKDLSEVVVKATRATEKSAMAFSNVYEKTIKKQNLGQDMPFLLNLLPSVVVSSDAGAGVGYTGIRVRGTDPTRINVTFNGVPQNDAESQGLYWVNTPDLASSVKSVQLQRGVGTSTNGGSAFGATLNINTLGLENESFIELNSSYGSFNTSKLNLKASSGLLKNGLTFDARLSNIASDGYIDRAASNLKSGYFSAGYFHKDNFVRLIAIQGKERTYQAWEGVPEEMLKTDRTFNPYTYKNQVDDYAQGNYQLVASIKLNKNWRLNPTLHYTKGKGFYEQFREAEKLSKYNITDPTKVGVKRNLVRQKWLDNHFYGAVFSLDYEANTALELHFGGGLNQYDGKHYGDVVSVEDLPQFKASRWYQSASTKTDFNLFGKATYQFNPVLNGFLDLQIRRVAYDFNGTGDKMQNISNVVNYDFFNPKLGLNAQLNEHLSAYASYAVGNKEPSRQDFIDNAPTIPKAENLQDFEGGIRFLKPKFSANINAYWMQYKDQLVLTGAVNGVGEAIRVNVPNSFRKGIELEVSTAISSKFKMAGNLTLSQNKIKNFTETIVDYDTGVDVVKNYALSDISFSPNIIAGGQISYLPLQNLEISLQPKYVGKQFLDNTSAENKKLNGYFLTDCRIIFNPKIKQLKDFSVSLLVNNIFNKLYESNGYTYSYVYDKSVSVNNFYYPQAGTNGLMGVSLRF
jgi:iron complex outermembrane recepter protein